MSRTFRKVSQKMKSYYQRDKVKDGTPTRIAHSCTNNGGCSYCYSNRMYKNIKKILKVRNEFKEIGL